MKILKDYFLTNLLLQFFLICLAIEISFAAQNFITITERDGQTTQNYPIQIGRPFIKGEINNYPQAIVNGNPVLTQADVKCRWDDGSVKHAILTFLIPSLQAYNSITVTFHNQIDGNTTGYLNKNQMLDTLFNFDAVIELINNATQTASARNMLQSDAFEYWLKGSVVTSVILADHSSSRLFDMGFDSHRSFRPIFHATFWHSLNKVRLRFIGEITNSEVLQDQIYDLNLLLGSTQPITVYSQDNITHYAASRWTKEFWIGSTPSLISIDHNLEYLAETFFLPNYDMTKMVSPFMLLQGYNSLKFGGSDLFSSGDWQKAMSTAGGRPDIGPFPSWTVQWLYTGDILLKEKCFLNADLAAAWPMHFREGNPSKYFDRNKTIFGIAKILSISDRESIFLPYYDYSYTLPEDRVVFVGSYSNGGWIPDRAHQPAPFFPQYVLSGDYWYLEEMMFWASWSAANTNGAAINYGYGRGPTGAEGGISGDVRAQAWCMRNRAQTAFCIPDTMPEKYYFSTLLEDAIAIWEGERSITNTPFYLNSNWNWGNTYRGGNVSPQHHWWKGAENFVQGQIDPAITEKAASTWEQNFMMFALGRTKELGFPANELVNYLSINIIGQLTDPDYNPYFIASYRIPTVKRSTSQFFQTWADLKTGYKVSYVADPITSFNNTLLDADHGYAIIAISSVAMVAEQPGGQDAWSFIQTQALSAVSLNNNPKWAITPRNIFSSIKPSLPTGLRVEP